MRRLFCVVRGGRLCGWRGSLGCGGRLIWRFRRATRMAYPWHAHTARGRRLAMIVMVTIVIAMVAVRVVIHGIRRARDGLTRRITRRGGCRSRPAGATLGRGGVFSGYSVSSSGSVAGRGSGSAATARFGRRRGGRLRLPSHFGGGRSLLGGSGACPASLRRGRLRGLSGGDIGGGIDRCQVIRRRGILASVPATSRGKGFLIFWHEGLLSSGAIFNARVKYLPHSR